LVRAKREESVAPSKLSAMEANATASPRNVFGEEHQPSVAEERSFSDGELFAENKTSEVPRQENNAAEFIKDVKRSPTITDVLLSRRRDVGGLEQLAVTFI